MVANADSLCRVSLRGVLHAHRDKRAVATMVVRRGGSIGRYGAIAVNAHRQIVDIAGRLGTGAPAVFEAVFTGIHLFDPAVFEYMPPKDAFCINAEVYPAIILNTGLAFAYITPAPWLDFGDPESYLDGNIKFLKKILEWDPQRTLEWKNPARDVWIHPNCKIHPNVRLSPPCAIDRGSEVQANCEIGPGAIIGRGCTIGKGSRIVRSVIWDGEEIPGGSDWEGIIAGHGHLLVVPSRPA